MPTSETLVASDRHRRLQLQLRALTVRELLVLWRGVDLDQFDVSWPVFRQSAQTLVALRRAQSAGLAAAYYRTVRQVEVGPGDVAIRMSRQVAPERLLSSLEVTGPVTFRRALRAGKSVDQAAATSITRIAGAVSRHVQNGGRETILDTIEQDDKALGWERVTDPSPCAFCAMLASRGAVYKTENTGGFQPHDHCGCHPEPRFLNDDQISERNVEFRRMWNELATGRDQLKSFRRAYQQQRVS